MNEKDQLGSSTAWNSFFGQEWTRTELSQFQFSLYFSRSLVHSQVQLSHGETIVRERSTFVGKGQFANMLGSLRKYSPRKLVFTTEWRLSEVTLVIGVSHFRTGSFACFLGHPLNGCASAALPPYVALTESFGGVQRGIIRQRRSCLWPFVSLSFYLWYPPQRCLHWISDVLR